jgi:hypothetical protein
MDFTSRAGRGARRGVHPPRRLVAQQHKIPQHRGHPLARTSPSSASPASSVQRHSRDGVQLRRRRSRAAQRDCARAGGRRRGPAAVGALSRAGGVDVRGVRLHHRRRRAYRGRDDAARRGVHRAAVGPAAGHGRRGGEDRANCRGRVQEGRVRQHGRQPERVGVMP